MITYGIFCRTKKDKRTKRALEQAQIENQIAKTKANTMILNARISAAEKFTNTGYSHGGASRSESWAKGYDDESLSPSSDIEMNRKELRQRTRDLYMNAPIGTAAIKATRTSCVGDWVKTETKD